MILRLFQLTDSSSDEEPEFYQEKKVQFQISTRKGKFNSHHYYKNKHIKSASPEKGFRLSPVREQISSENGQLTPPLNVQEGNVGDASEDRTVPSNGLNKKTVIHSKKCQSESKDNENRKNLRHVSDEIFNQHASQTDGHDS